jgi:AraC-like DNA-binding protein
MNPHSDPGTALPIDETLQRQRLSQQIDNAFFAEPLFDALPDVVFFVKDAQGRYVVVNQTLVRRCGLKQKSALLGRTAAQVFPGAFGSRYQEQDRQVLADGSEIRDQLELHLYPNRDPGWCLTHKTALRDKQDNIVGLAGISRDLAMPDNAHPVYGRIAAAAHFIQVHYGQTIQLADLARISNLSASQIERYFDKIFSLSPRQMIIKTRLDAASKMLAEENGVGGVNSVTEIAIACGYHDHSAFTRQFKATVGMTPSAYRAMQKNL